MTDEELLDRTDVRGYLAPIEQHCFLRKELAQVEFDFYLNNKLHRRIQVVVNEKGKSTIEPHLLPIGGMKRYAIQLNH